MDGVSCLHCPAQAGGDGAQRQCCPHACRGDAAAEQCRREVGQAGKEVVGSWIPNRAPSTSAAAATCQQQPQVKR